MRASETRVGPNLSSFKYQNTAAAPPSGKCALLIAPQLESAILAARGDARAIGTPVNGKDLVGMSWQILHKLAKRLAALIKVKKLDCRVLGRADEEARV
eukprot:CAMPEP_0173089316 /NCGR_PEP_ID=MMETSP1102-20130122/25802_1 /TAXON_ID=49646 /ORGANISM="Geminigera sp., Strain Caron Lab Isolate" /LENGTH=98 /DNA_ID=CAMNT_0013973077 /DNA_START=3 /DNA_END=299 /DNA_ORIENTATION=+